MSKVGSKIVFIGFLGMILSLAQHGYAQNNCARLLNEAENDYQRGNLYAIPDKLKDCLKEGFQKEEKVQAYRLLTLAYLNINQEDNAKESLISLLKVNPEYKVSESAPVEFLNLYNQINTQPYMYLGLHVSGGLSNVKLLNIYSASSLENHQQQRYKAGFYISAGLQGIVPVNKNFSLAMQLNYTRFNHSYQESMVLNWNNPVEAQRTTFSENNSFIDVPVAFRYVKDLGKIKITGQAGPSVSYLFNAQLNEVLRENILERSQLAQESFINMMDHRVRFNYGYQLQAGVFFNFLGLSWETKAGFREMIRNQVTYASQTERLESSLKYDYLFVENDYRLQSFFVSLMITKPFYNFYKVKK